VVVVIHDINLAVQYADKLIFLKDGAIAAQGNPAAILTEALVEKVFGVKASILLHPASGTPLVVYNPVQASGSAPAG